MVSGLRTGREFRSRRPWRAAQGAATSSRGRGEREGPSEFQEGARANRRRYQSRNGGCGGNGKAPMICRKGPVPSAPFSGVRREKREGPDDLPEGARTLRSIFWGAEGETGRPLGVSGRDPCPRRNLRAPANHRQRQSRNGGCGGNGKAPRSFRKGPGKPPAMPIPKWGVRGEREGPSEFQEGAPSPCYIRLCGCSINSW